MKSENGFQIFWHGNEVIGDPARREPDDDATVEVFDLSGHPETECNLSKLIRAADPAMSGVSIYDVFARKPGSIAVAAVYARTAGIPVALLLLLNWDGSLPCKVVLDQQPEISIAGVGCGRPCLGSEFVRPRQSRELCLFRVGQVGSGPS